MAQPVEPVLESGALLARMIDEVFNQPDPRRRAEVVAEVFTDDVVFVDGERTVVGRAELAATVTELLERGPGLVFTPSGSFRGVGDLGMRAWRLGPPDGDSVLGGLDVVEVADGRISRLWTLLDT